VEDEITGPEAELFAAITMAEQQTKAAQEQRRAVETALVHLQQAITRMDAAVQNLSATERVLKAGMEEAARTVFSAQADELVRNVRQQVQQSVGQLETAAHNVKRKVFVTRWSELAVVFALGVLAIGIFGYFEIKQPLDETWNAQAVLFQHMQQIEAQKQSILHAPARMKSTTKPQSQP
jgi:hypothetical protein